MKVFIWFWTREIDSTPHGCAHGRVDDHVPIVVQRHSPVAKRPEVRCEAEGSDQSVARESAG